jgi:hypothetical protein
MFLYRYAIAMVALSISTVTLSTDNKNALYGSSHDDPSIRNPLADIASKYQIR